MIGWMVYGGSCKTCRSLGRHMQMFVVDSFSFGIRKTVVFGISAPTLMGKKHCLSCAILFRGIQNSD